MSNKLRIKIGEIEIEVEGDNDLIERERQQFFSILPAAISSVSNILNHQGFNIQKDQAVNEIIENVVYINDGYKDQVFKSVSNLATFIKEKSFASSSDLVLGVCYYMEKYENEKSININDIINSLSSARHPKLSNPNAFINNNVEKGYLIEEKEKKGGKKSFKISVHGISYIDKHVPKQVNEKRKANRKANNTQYVSKYSEITRSELNLSSYPEVKKLNSFKEKMVLIMYIFMKEGKGDYFNINDLLFLFPQTFGEKVTKKQIEGLLSREPSWFDKIKDDNKKLYKYKLLNGAVDFVENIIMSSK